MFKSIYFLGLSLTLASMQQAKAEILENKNTSERIQRYALVVGKNNGGNGRAELRYAASDAQAFSKVLEELGGLDPVNRILLINPSEVEFLASFNRMKKRLKDDEAQGVRREFFIYYSGHSNEKGLLLGNQTVAYGKLKTLIQSLHADLNVIILDSCASGVLTRTKGGQKRPPFLEETISKLKGNVVLTSASADESAQESDRIQGSFFTHYLIAGLRGAADYGNRKKVTLNDVYQYSYHNTLTRTENTLSGPQHPSYSIDLSGNGELVITDLRKATSTLSIPKGFDGRLFVRDKRSRMVAELDLVSQRPMSLGLEPGKYTLVWSKQKKNYVSSIDVRANETVDIQTSQFEKLSLEETRARGEIASEDEVSENLTQVPIEFSVYPGISTNILDPEITENNFSFSLAYHRAAKITGFEFSLGASVVFQEVRGLQLGVFYNRSNEVHGAQVGLVNHTTDQLNGLQFGIWNSTQKAELAAQVGIVNQIKDSSLDGIQLGVVSTVSGSVNGGQFSGLVNLSDGDSIKGIQMAGLANISKAKKIQGIQIAGLVNSVEKVDIEGIQAASLYNSAESVQGLQLGFLNRTEKLQGVQTGIINQTNTVAGAQIGLVNQSNNVHGTQIGLINYSDGEDEGFALGVINISKSSRWRLSYSLNDLSIHMLGVKYGTRYIYSTLEMGLQNYQNVTTYPKTAGMGISLPLSECLAWNFETVVMRLDYTSFIDLDAPLLMQYRTYPKIIFTDSFSIFGGLSFTHFARSRNYNRVADSVPSNAWGSFIFGAEVAI